MDLLNCLLVLTGIYLCYAICVVKFGRLHSEKADSLFCLQLIRPENKRHLGTLTISHILFLQTLSLH